MHTTGAPQTGGGSSTTGPGDDGTTDEAGTTTGIDSTLATTETPTTAMNAGTSTGSGSTEITTPIGGTAFEGSSGVLSSLTSSPTQQPALNNINQSVPTISNTSVLYISIGIGGVIVVAVASGIGILIARKRARQKQLTLILSFTAENKITSQQPSPSSTPPIVDLVPLEIHLDFLQEQLQSFVKHRSAAKIQRFWKERRSKRETAARRIQRAWRKRKQEQIKAKKRFAKLVQAIKQKKHHQTTIDRKSHLTAVLVQPEEIPLELRSAQVEQEIIARIEKQEKLERDRLQQNKVQKKAQMIQQKQILEDEEQKRNDSQQAAAVIIQRHWRERKRTKLTSANQPVDKKMELLRQIQAQSRKLLEQNRLKGKQASHNLWKKGKTALSRQMVVEDLRKRSQIKTELRPGAMKFSAKKPSLLDADALTDSSTFKTSKMQ